MAKQTKKQTKKQIKVGSRVMWRGSWGKDPAVEATVKDIEETEEPHSKDGHRVDSIDFDRRDYSIIVLDNCHWCYGEQIVEVLD